MASATLLSDKQLYVVGGVAIVGAGLLLWGATRLVSKATDTAGGVLSGNNELTAGTAYEGKGVVGTLGAAANTITGGFLGSLGSDISLAVSDLFGPSYDPNGDTL
jgi:hypothetical protein